MRLRNDNQRQQLLLLPRVLPRVHQPPIPRVLVATAAVPAVPTAVPPVPRSVPLLLGLILAPQQVPVRPEPPVLHPRLVLRVPVPVPVQALALIPILFLSSKLH